MKTALALSLHLPSALVPAPPPGSWGKASAFRWAGGPRIREVIKSEKADERMHALIIAFSPLNVAGGS